MEHVTSTLCSKVIEDARTRLLSLIELLDVLEVAEVPPIVPSASETTAIGPVNLAIVSVWYRTLMDEPEIGTSRVILKAPDNKKIPLVAEQKIDLETAISSRTLIFMPAMPYRGLGRYSFLVEQLSANG